jgi:hypothetical protein
MKRNLQNFKPTKSQLPIEQSWDDFVDEYNGVSCTELCSKQNKKRLFGTSKEFCRWCAL